MRTVAKQGRALMIPVGDPDEASMLRRHIQVVSYHSVDVTSLYSFVTNPLTNSAFKMQRAMHRLRKVAAHLGCRCALDVAVPQQLGAGPSTTHVGGTSSSHGAHGGRTSSSHGAATSAEGGQGHGHYDDEDDEG